MSLWLDGKYMRLVGGQLDQFKAKGPQFYTFRCPFCGDSAKKKTKTRGYVYALKTFLFFKCHNCGEALPFGAFLKRVSRALYDNYSMERFHEQHGHRVATAPEPPPVVPTPTIIVDTSQTPLLSSKSLSDAIAPVREYIIGRKLPSSALSRLSGTVLAHTWLLPMVGEKKAAAVVDGEPYLVIPLTLPDGTWYGAQLRLLTRHEYLTFRWGHEGLRAFGLDVCNRDELVYCVEGPLDALCLPNAVGMCGSDLKSGLARLDDAGYPVANRVLVWDNEPRNKQISTMTARAIEQGERVVIWPRSFPKDLNDMVAAGYDVLDVVQKRTYHGLIALLEFQQWQQ